MQSLFSFISSNVVCITYAAVRETDLKSSYRIKCLNLEGFVKRNIWL